VLTGLANRTECCACRIIGVGPDGCDPASFDGGGASRHRAAGAAEVPVRFAARFTAQIAGFLGSRAQDPRSRRERPRVARRGVDDPMIVTASAWRR
jgi:hypothetical protein